jgi:hypothetical protein
VNAPPIVRFAGPVSLSPKAAKSRPPVPAEAPVPEIAAVPVEAPVPEIASADGQTMECLWVTPEVAAFWLSVDVLRRPTSTDQVSRFARDMRAGNWPLNAETVKRDSNGGVMDGTHRLKACVEAGVPFISWVAQGVPPEHQRTVDTGRPRTITDNLALAGNANPAVLGAVAKRAWQWLHGYRGFKMPSPSQIEVDELIAAVPLIRTAADYAVGARKEFPAVPTAVYGISYLVFNQAGGQLASRVFLDQVVLAAHLEYEDPANALRRRMIRASTTKERLREAEKFALFVYAWNAFAEERTLDSVQLPKGGLRAANFPKPSGLQPGSKILGNG